MFTDSTVPFLYRAAKLKVDEKTGTRTAEITLQIEPFTGELAKVYPDMTEAVFNQDGLITDNGALADGFEAATRRPGIGRQYVAFRLHPSTGAEMECVVSVLQYKAKRCEAKDCKDWARFSITLEVPLDERPTREFVINHLGHAVYLVSADVQPLLEEVQGDG